MQALHHTQEEVIKSHLRALQDFSEADLVAAGRSMEVDDGDDFVGPHQSTVQEAADDSSSDDDSEDDMPLAQLMRRKREAASTSGAVEEMM